MEHVAIMSTNRRVQGGVPWAAWIWPRKRQKGRSARLPARTCSPAPSEPDELPLGVLPGPVELGQAFKFRATGEEKGDWMQAQAARDGALAA